MNHDTNTAKGDGTAQSRRAFLNTLGVGFLLARASDTNGPPKAAESPPAPPERALVEVLRGAGKVTRVVTNPDGTRLLLLPHGGRMLGLYAPGAGDNFYWTHPALQSVETARQLYASNEWHNSGGDRTWLAPEVDIFLPNYPSKDKYFQPRELDPGHYQLEDQGGHVRLINRLTLTLSRSRKTLKLELAKSFRPAPNPLRHERQGLPAGLEYAGYTQQTSLRITGGDTTGPVGLWNLVQMPHGGELLVPTYSRATPKLVFGNIPEADLVASDRLVRYRMRQVGEHKIALRAIATPGRVGYVFQQGERWAVIIRNFVVNPSGEYVDVPWDDPTDLGYSTQACNVNSGLGQFSELEYHIPAIGGATGRQQCDDTAQVWAFRGSKEGVATVVHSLLCPEPI